MKCNSKTDQRSYKGDGDFIEKCKKLTGSHKQVVTQCIGLEFLT